MPEASETTYPTLQITTNPELHLILALLQQKSVWDLFEVNPCDKDKEQICEAITKSEYLTSLILSKTRITHVSLQMILQSLNDKSITQLDLSENDIGLCSTVLANFIATKSTLTHLFLSDCAIDDNGIQIICRAVQESSLQLLDLEGNGTDAAGKHLAELLIHNTHLESLSFGADRMTEFSIEQVANALKIRNRTLKHLFIGGEMTLTAEKSGTCIAKMLRHNKNLKVLNLVDTSLDDQTLKPILEVWCSQWYFKTLTLDKDFLNQLPQEMQDFLKVCEERNAGITDADFDEKGVFKYDPDDRTGRLIRMD